MKSNCSNARCRVPYIICGAIAVICAILLMAASTSLYRTCSASNLTATLGNSTEQVRIAAGITTPVAAVTAPNSSEPLPPRAEQLLYSKKARVNYSEIWMSPLEVNLILRHIEGSRKYIEWGSGGSTFNFPQFVKQPSPSNTTGCGVLLCEPSRNVRIFPILNTTARIRCRTWP